jgi:crotonobetainyl-CoA:carnitine CoA-transferase CaiB-like acyl-CoA transferase
MEGVRVLEVAQFTYVPSAGAVLADWGADVIKVEHAVTGDAQRGLTHLGSVPVGDDSFSPLMEHPNRGKRSIGLALEEPSALVVLYDLVRTSDVFLTNFLPAARQRLKIDVPDIRRVNPGVIYVRGSAFGSKGSERHRGGYDHTAFWARGGSAAGITPPDAGQLLGMPAPAYGDSIGGMTIAGGIAAALFARERTGDPSIVDVSLLSVGAWSIGLAVDVSLKTKTPWPVAPLSERSPGTRTNPLVGAYQTADGQWVALSMLQPGRYWADFCRHLGRSDLVDDVRFAAAESIVEHALVAGEIIKDEIATRTLGEWSERFRSMEGQWAPAQDSEAVGRDDQLRANGYIARLMDADGVPRELVLNPVQFDETAPVIGRAPQFAEHTDEILRFVNRSEEDILQLKIEGAAT